MLGQRAAGWQLRVTASRYGSLAPKEASLRRAALIMLLLSVVSACGAHGVVVQTGESGPPFQLLVVFRADTGTAVATKVLSGCRHQPDVIRVGRLAKVHGVLTATIYTKDVGQSDRTKPLLGCLQAAGSVQAAAWPG
jgi:hypothetical protein